MEFLEQQFDTAFDAPGGIKRLRELVLTLAIRGKLVAQDLEDKSATFKESVDSSDLPYPLPITWTAVRLGDAVDFIGGSQPAKNKFIYEEKAEYVRLVQIRDFKSDAYKTYIPQEYARRPFSEEDVMIGRYGPPVFQILRGLSGTYNVALMKASPTIDSLSTDYLYYLLQEPRIQNIVIADSSRTAGQSGVRKELLNGIVVLIPPLPEQRRIVAKIDQLMARCDELEKLRTERDRTQITVHTAALNRLLTAQTSDTSTDAWQFIAQHFGELYSVKENVAELRKAILQLAVMGKLVEQDPSDEPVNRLLQEISAEKQRLTKEKKPRKPKPLPELLPEELPVNIPDSWEWVRFEELVDIGSGVTKGRKLQGRTLISLPYLRVANVQRGYLNLKVMKEIEIPEDELNKYTLHKEDLLITEGGDWDKVGRTAIWNSEIPECIHQNHVFRARRYLQKQNVFWLEKFLNSTIARTYFAGASKQTTNLASINKTQLRGCPVPIPPLSEQHRIVAKVDQLMTLCNTLEQHIDNATHKQTTLLNAVMAQV